MLPDALQKTALPIPTPSKTAWDQLPCIIAQTGHHQSFKYLPIYWVIISFPFNLQGHLHLLPPALLGLLAADSQRHSAGGEMRSRPNSYFLSVGGVFTWVNMVQAKCLIGSKGEEARSEKPPPRCVSQPQCPTHGLMHYDQLQLQCGICSSNHFFTR